VEHLCASLGHADRHVDLRGYCAGLMCTTQAQACRSHGCTSATHGDTQRLTSKVAGGGSLMTPADSNFGHARRTAITSAQLGPEQCALIAWPEHHYQEPMTYWLPTLAEDVSLQRMVLQAQNALAQRALLPRSQARPRTGRLPMCPYRLRTHTRLRL
jgi:hypothetical protein